MAFNLPPAAPGGHYNPSVPYTPWDQDPGYVAAQGAQQRNDANASSYLNQLMQSAQYGYNGAGNPYSTLALLKQGDAQNTQGYLNSLAARGILASGQTGNSALQESKAYGMALYNAQRALAANEAAYRNNYLTTLGNDQAATSAALSTAWQNYLNNPGLYPRPAAPSTWGGAGALTGGGQQIAKRSTVGQLTGTPGAYGGGY